MSKLSPKLISKKEKTGITNTNNETNIIGVTANQDHFIFCELMIQLYWITTNKEFPREVC